MSYEAKGILVSRGNTEQVTESFKKRDFAIKLDDGGQYENFANFQVVQDRCSLLDGLKPGTELLVHFDLRGRKWNEKYFTNLNAWKVEVLSSEGKEPAKQEAAKLEPVAASEDNSDLPF